MTTEYFKETWQEICFLLSENLPSNISEKDYDTQIIRAIEKLGWSQFKGEVDQQVTLPAGRRNVRADFVIYGDKRKPLIVVEAKRPADELKDNAKEQLKSCMRLLKAEFGVLIGSHIRLYYDGKDNPQNDVFQFIKTDFSKSSKTGIRFVEFLEKNSFLSQSYSEYLMKQIHSFNEEQQIDTLRKQICTKKIQEKVTSFIRTEFPDFSDEVFSKAMNDISIEIAPNEKPGSNSPPPVKDTQVTLKDIDFWGKPLDTKIIPTSCNVNTAIRRMLNNEKLQSWETKHIKELGAKKWGSDLSREILNNPGGHECRQAIEKYKQRFKQTGNHNDIPKSILNAFLVGYFPIANNADQKRKHFIQWVMQNKLVNKRGSAGAIFQVGSTAGRAFGLLDENNYPTDLYFEYFELNR